MVHYMYVQLRRWNGMETASNIIRYLRACGTNMLICVRTVNTGVSQFEIILTSALIIIAPHSALISTNALITNFIINQINQPTSD